MQLTLPGHSLFWRKARGGVQVGTGGKTVVEHFIAVSLADPHLANYLIQSRLPTKGIVPPTVAWASLHQLAILPRHAPRAA